MYVCMYVIELNCIWIWKYIENYFHNWFENYLNCFWKNNLSQLKHGIMGTSWICVL